MLLQSRFGATKKQGHLHSTGMDTEPSRKTKENKWQVTDLLVLICWYVELSVFDASDGIFTVLLKDKYDEYVIIGMALKFATNWQ